MAAYQAALAIVSPPPPSPKHVIAGSLAAVTAGYFRSADYANLSPSSQTSYQRGAETHSRSSRAPARAGASQEAARHIVEAIGAARPGMANLTRSVLSKVMTYAIETGIRTNNPFAGLKPYRLGTYHTWTDAEIAQFERRWPLGTRERLAFRPAPLHRAARGRRREDAARRHRRRPDPRVPRQGPQGHDHELHDSDTSRASSRTSSRSSRGNDTHHHRHPRATAEVIDRSDRGGCQTRRTSAAMRRARTAQGSPSPARRARVDNQRNRRGERAPFAF